MVLDYSIKMYNILTYFLEFCSILSSSVIKYVIRTYLVTGSLKWKIIETADYTLLNIKAQFIKGAKGWWQ